MFHLHHLKILHFLQYPNGLLRKRRYLLYYLKIVLIHPDNKDKIQCHLYFEHLYIQYEILLCQLYH